MMAVFFFTAQGKGFKFHAQPQTGASSCFESAPTSQKFGYCLYLDIVAVHVSELFQVDLGGASKCILFLGVEFKYFF